MKLKSDDEIIIHEDKDIYRLEKMLFKIKLDIDKLTEDERQLITKLFKCEFHEGNVITIAYEFDIEYYKCIKRFKAILGLLDKAVVLNVNTKVLKKEMCLIQELFCKLEQLEQKYILRRLNESSNQ